jgi:hypothetical protein
MNDHSGAHPHIVHDTGHDHALGHGHTHRIVALRHWACTHCGAEWTSEAPEMESEEVDRNALP